jgi:hypothetical protein
VTGDFSNIAFSSATFSFELDDALDAAGADHARHADIEVGDAVLAGEVRGEGRTRFLSFR